MADYLTLKEVLESKISARESEMSLIDNLCRSYFLFHSQPTDKVCLFFHGFTAGPYQFIPMAQDLYKQGYNVIVPLLPGHGIAGKWGPSNPPPLTDNPRLYLKFGLQWLKIAKRFGAQVIVGGLSGGGTLATWLAMEKADDIHRAILFAPYFSASSKVIDLFVKHVDTYFEWEKLMGPSYPGFELAALRAVLRIADYNFKRVKQAPIAPIFMVSSESDRAVNNFDHQRFFDAALEQQPYCWYHSFSRVLDIPHTMMTEAEGNRYTSLLTVMAKANINSNLTWHEVEEIAYRMSKRRTFKSVVAELGWGDKVSRDMPAMMTLVDKWSIAVKRELQYRQRLQQQ
ncbi:alpha/beta hydrolase [Leptothoe kymatousa]|uniref:Alpha/beta fold hydrolase n=1 Tax=Leptothoe kymatousa TAU-MAC 1615 TaxID=2364775 RepID=A0ABS5Y1I3_9CYAN|nr:alpha/beta fold hydrolase [Leptothoe kymatousa]MBT9311694.1 alpha/beta fold hydrolase [Leptothoe kymatousa TAU-MAC 1615]